MVNVKHSHIYIVLKKILYCGKCRGITGSTHSFWNIAIEFGQSFFY